MFCYYTVYAVINTPLMSCGKENPLKMTSLLKRNNINCPLDISRNDVLHQMIG